MYHGFPNGTPFVAQEDRRGTSYHRDPVMILMRRGTDPKTTTQTLCEPAQSESASSYNKSHLRKNFEVKCRRPRPGTNLCAGLRGRNALHHIIRASYSQLMRELTSKTARPETTLCASLRGRNAYGHVKEQFQSLEPFYAKKIHEKGWEARVSTSMKHWP